MSIPSCIRGPYTRIQTSVLAAISEAYSTQGPGDASTRTRRQTQAWKLFLLLPRMLLHRVGHHAAKSISLLQDRIRRFDSSRRPDLLEGAGARYQPS